jgi:hypothetical protein
VRWIDLALGDLDVADRETVTEVLEAVCFVGLIGLVSGRTDADEFDARLDRAARALLTVEPVRAE